MKGWPRCSGRGAPHRGVLWLRRNAVHEAGRLIGSGETSDLPREVPGGWLRRNRLALTTPWRPESTAAESHNQLLDNANRHRIISFSI